MKTNLIHGIPPLLSQGAVQNERLRCQVQIMQAERDNLVLEGGARAAVKMERGVLQVAVEVITILIVFLVILTMLRVEQKRVVAERVSVAGLGSGESVSDYQVVLGVG